MKVKIHHEGENILLMLFLIIVASGALAYRFFDYKPVAWGLITLMAILFLLVLNFFRLPRRHYSGDNLESPKRVTDIKNLCDDLLTGKRQGIKSDGNNGGNDMMAEGDGFRLTYSSQTGLK